MLSTKLYINLGNAFHHARDSGYKNQVMPTPKDLHSELTYLNSHTQSTASMGYGDQGQISI